ncbi:MAG: FxDxF family PEP-CTERM protein [Burkholderiales bacterium]|nr:FxDxF family PEP-CTERM protein [Burkholderiales bacterium]
MKRRSNTIATVITVLFAFYMQQAQALQPGPIDSSFVNNGASFDAVFGNDSVSFSPFEDHYTFSAISPMFDGGGMSIVSGFSFSGFNVRFNSFELLDVTTSTVIATGSILAGQFLGFASFPGLVSGNDYDVVVSGELNSGFLSGSYSGNISIAPIPEPKAYAMLVAGLGLVAFAAFRRRHNYY